MQKVTLISILSLLLLFNCSVLKHQRQPDIDFNNYSDSIDICANNITKSGFYIKKAEIELFENEEKSDFLVTIKYSDNKYLLNLKMKSGIDIAKALITSDSILINNRINRICYYGSAVYLKEKYGINTNFIPIILGDYIKINEKTTENSKCNKGLKSIVYSIDDKLIEYFINCENFKIASTIIKDKSNKESIKMFFNKFMNIGGKLFPTKIEIFDLNKDSKIVIEIKDIEVNWNGKIEFLPGKNYEIVKLK